MSRLIERLEKASQQVSQPLGFGAPGRRNDGVLSMLLVGRPAQGESRRGNHPHEPVDAYLVSVNSWDTSHLDGIVESVRDRLWGARVHGFNGSRAGDLKKRGCDFVVFDPNDTSAEVLNNDDLGKLMAVGPNLTEDTARAIHELPIDGLLLCFDATLLPLTVHKLIEIERVRTLSERPFLLQAPSELGPPELESLRNAGVSGLVLELSSTDSLERMADAIAGLPRRKPRPSSIDAIATPPPFTSEPHSHEDDDF